ncbi:MAG TPA: DnaJ domain-containing protein [Bacteroidales bacterium]|nr:DnaJ domain-containing protein [Bacteroidales bacterium]
MSKNYFEILNLTPPATEEEIKQAYRTLAKIYHPDINPGPDAHQRFLEISEAYEFLLEDLKNKGGRIIYDQDDVISREYIEELRRKARERAEERARLRYEKLQKEHEEFQESGLYDAVLVLSYLMRYGGFLLCLLLVFFLL